tara:strand:+ start:46354 stop:47493 length:1140 start_codon:yes stop_codon:yes gene_type:complete
MSLDLAADELRPQRLQSKIANVQPMTGIVVWSTNEAASTAPIQLEFAYLKYNQVVQEKGKYNWQPVERLLDEIAGRKHQAILRWHDTYVGEPTGAPAFIKALPNYREITEKSENKLTGFPDWSNQEWQAFVLEFYTRFAEKYDRDPRLAFVQVGFGLWAEYHIYDGPMKPGETFPDKDYQRTFIRHLTSRFRETPWMISVDAAGDHAPFAEDALLSKSPFGIFDDSFNHQRHEKENEPNWHIFGMDRWKRAPTGGEFSFFRKKDQKDALAPNGPYGIPFAEQAAKFHVSFIIGDDQGEEDSGEKGEELETAFEVTLHDCIIIPLQTVHAVGGTGDDLSGKTRQLQHLAEEPGLLAETKRRGFDGLHYSHTIRVIIMDFV